MYVNSLDKKIFLYTENSKEYWERERKRHFISCWIESDYELALMWDTYGKDGVAIRTTVGNLIESLAEDKEHDQYLARVKYIDDQSGSSQHSTMGMNVLQIPLSKRKYYEQEKEIRLLYTKSNVNDQTGISFPVDLNCLISEVRVHPNAPQYFLDIINSELEAAGIDIIAMFSVI